MKRAITITEARSGAAAIHADEINKQVILKNCAPVNECISKINHAQGDNGKDLVVVVLMYNLIK